MSSPPSSFNAVLVATATRPPSKWQKSTDWLNGLVMVGKGTMSEGVEGGWQTSARACSWDWNPVVSHAGESQSGGHQVHNIHSR